MGKLEVTARSNSMADSMVKSDDSRMESDIGSTKKTDDGLPIVGKLV